MTKIKGRTKPPKKLYGFSCPVDPSTGKAPEEYELLLEAMREENDHQRKHSGGNPLRYNATIPDRASKLILCGLRESDLGIAFGVHRKTIWEWKKKYPTTFGEAVQKAKDMVASGLVEKSLLRKALGYTYKEITREVVKEIGPDGLPTGRRIMGITKEVTKHVPPSSTCIIFYLCNRETERWKHINKVEVSGEDGKPITISHQLSDVERSARIAALLESARERGIGQVVDCSNGMDSASWPADSGLKQ